MASIFDPATRVPPSPPPTKTLILNLGVPGEGVTTPSSLATVQIDGEPPGDITTLNLVVDATNGEPAYFCLHRVKVADGLLWTSEEPHVISNLSLIIEYQEG